ncbi:MAG TPA: hypothetical protein VM900_05965 [Sphingomonas sp.]|nr:hypothetical protein [Sphingomonas sp.]
MTLLLALAVQAATRAVPPASPPALPRCASLVDAAAQRACTGLAFAADRRWAEAAGDFEAAAKFISAPADPRRAVHWAQAGNAWLAAGDAAKARAALDNALLAGSLAGLALGEAQLDHARAMVALDDPEAARRDIDLALKTAAADPLAWLLSATLARRGGDIVRARTDIAEALKRAADDAAVQLEAGNIAATARDEAGARAAWTAAARIAPGSEQGRAAIEALRQFDVPAPTPAP